MKRIGSLALLLLAVGNLRAQVPAGYDTQTLRGFKVHQSPAVQRRPPDRWQRTPQVILEAEFDDLARVLPPTYLKLLREVPIYVQWDESDAKLPGAIARYFAGTPEQIERGGNPKHLSRSIEIMSLRRLSELRAPGTKYQQIITLHEMAHAIHDRHLGDHPEVVAAYRQAVERKLYDRVHDRDQVLHTAYARTNEYEYFAELTCAYLDSCNAYPFNYADLQAHDPVGFRLMQRVYTKPESFKRADGPLKLAATVSAAPAATAAKPPAKPDVNAERDAALRLDAIRKQYRDGEQEPAKKALAELLTRYPGTFAADEAKQLQNQWK